MTIFLSAFLLFVVQLILGKFILPWYGGAPAVWTTCMLFFQTTLLLGYTYAHGLSTRYSPATQGRLHLGLLSASVLILAWSWWRWGLPILPTDTWKPDHPGQPIRHILLLLAVSVGLPFFLLSATSPLLQRWFSLGSTTTNPYRLYALSNAGSLLGLLSYPFVIEPLTRVSSQGFAWGIGYLIFVVAGGACALKLLNPVNLRSPTEPPVAAGMPVLDWQTTTLWVLVAAATSSMFLSVTNMLCQDIAVVPLLWVLPLAIYLLSFILCFESDRWYRRRGFVTATALATLLVLAAGTGHPSFALTTTVLVHGLFLFLFCTTCHGELVRLKPGPTHLTLFYLIIALGGVMGSVFVGLVAPLVFKGYWELHLTLAGGWILLAVIFARDRSSFLHQGDRWQFVALVLLISYVTLDWLLPFTPLRHMDLFWRNLLSFNLASAVLLTVVAMAVWWRRPVAHWTFWPRLLVGATIFLSVSAAWQRTRSAPDSTLAAQRNFYGVIRVIRSQVQVDGESVPLVQLTHGRINHGSQVQDDGLSRQPVGYYSQNSGIELAMRLHPRRKQSQPTRIGVLGLGVGTLAAFAREGDTVRFYEINPAVGDYCTGLEPYFTYLRDCDGRVEMVLGDARLLLERELRENEPAQFDILAMDAFSGDSVPVHLLTVEALKVYQAHLRDEDGIIAVNISNQFLDLRDLMFSLAGHFGLEAVIIDNRGNPPDRTSSRWCLLTKNRRFLQQEAIQRARTDYRAQREILWTDDFSNLFQLLR